MAKERGRRNEEGGVNRRESGAVGMGTKKKEEC